MSDQLYTGEDRGEDRQASATSANAALTYPRTTTRIHTHPYDSTRPNTYTELIYTIHFSFNHNFQNTAWFQNIPYVLTNIVCLPLDTHICMCRLTHTHASPFIECSVLHLSEFSGNESCATCLEWNIGITHRAVCPGKLGSKRTFENSCQISKRTVENSTQFLLNWIASGLLRICLFKTSQKSAL